MNTKEKEMSEIEQKRCGCYFTPFGKTQKDAIIKSIEASKNGTDDVLEKRDIEDKKRFRYGDDVELIGDKNPFKGEVGEFRRYADEERLIVFLPSDESEHYFCSNEIVMKTPYFEKIFGTKPKKK
jgi:hypothetical protein